MVACGSPFVFDQIFTFFKTCFYHSKVIALMKEMNKQNIIVFLDARIYVRFWYQCQLESK